MNLFKAIILALTLLSITSVNAQDPRDNYTVIVSLDGFRYDYPEAYNTPFFDSMATMGVKATMSPSFPSKTFPNHYTLATGLVPDHHGIVANSFLNREKGKYYSIGNTVAQHDGSFYGGEPIWITAKKQGVKTSTIYWVGSEVNLKGGHPDYWKFFDVKALLSFDQRIDTAISHLSLPEKIRPHLVMVYFEEPDAIGHKFGPHSKQTRTVVENLDSLMGVFYTKLMQLPIADKINFIVTSDHGMVPISPDRTIRVKNYIKDSWVEKVDGNSPALIYCHKGCTDSVLNALKDVPHLRAWKRQDVPNYLQYGSNLCIGDIVALPDPGWLFTDDTNFSPGGQHGYDHTIDDVQVMFRAVGPDFKQGYIKPQKFQNTNIYSLLAHLLGIKPCHTDGHISNVIDMLKN